MIRADRPGSVAARRSVALAALLACSGTASVHAQALDPRPTRTVQSVRAIGLFGDGLRTFRIGETNGAITARVTLDRYKPTQHVIDVPLAAYANGTLEGTAEANGARQHVAFKALVQPYGRLPMLAVSSREGARLLPIGEFYPQLDDVNTSALARYAGVWNVSGGTVTLRLEGNLLVGEYARSLPGGFSEPIFHYAFSPQIKDSTKRLLGAWGEAADDMGGEASLEVSPDGNALNLRSVRTGVERVELLKRSKTPGTGAATGVRVVVGSAAPKPGYTRCGAWCEYRVVSFETRVRQYFDNGPAPVAILKIRVHNVTGQSEVLRGTTREETPYGALRVAWGRTGGEADQGLFNAAGPALNPDVQDAASIGDFLPVPQVEFPGGGEAELTYVTYRMPTGADALELGFGNAAPTKLPAKEWTCAFHRKTAELANAGSLGIWTPDAQLPSFCEGVTATTPEWMTASSAAASGATGATGTGNASTGSTGTAGADVTGTDIDAATANAEASPPTNSGGALPLPKPTQSTTTSDGFAKLGKYAVKVESTEVRADGRYQLVAVLKNMSSAPLYLTSNQLMVHAEDADGVGQQTGQVWRASGETPALFAATPVIPPGATLRARWLFRADPEAPIRKVSFSEGIKTVEFAE